MKTVADTSHHVVIDGLVKTYRGFTLGPVSATIPPGVTALLGANGAGKTTLMRLIVGSLRASQGSIHVPGLSSTVGFLPQDFVGPKRPTVQDYLTYIAWCRSTRRITITASHVNEALEAVGLIDRRKNRIGTLSGGMVRRLGVAQALLGNPTLVVLDEPTVGLDPIQRQDLRQLMAQLGERATVLLSTHLAEDVAAIASSVLVLDKGQLFFDGSVPELCGGQTVTSEALEAGFLRLVRDSQRNESDA